MNEITRIINAIEEGDSQASEELLPLVYEELRVLAAQKMAQERTSHTLKPTVLAYVVCIRLVGPDIQSWDNRGHLFREAVEAIRRILIESVMGKKRQEWGGIIARLNSLILFCQSTSYCKAARVSKLLIGADSHRHRIRRDFAK